jgi:amino acid adenylation domain-containing protein
MAEQIYIFAASSAQRSLWFLDQLAPGSALYNLHTAARLASELNVAALERSLNEIVQRHESLRTAFKDVEGEPVQAVAANLEVKLQVVDLTAVPQQQREDTAYRLVAEEAEKPFDLSTWPLIRAHLVRLDREDSVLLVVFHHIVCDFWSVEIFTRELNILYEAFCAGKPSPLSELPIQYGDFAEWQSEWLQGAEAAAHLDYWKKQLADLPVLQMPTDWPRPLEPSFAGAEHGFWLDEPIYEGLLSLSQQENVTLFMTLLAGLQILFHRYNDQRDFAVGTPIASRQRAELEDLIGFFVNSLVLRSDLFGNPTVAELLSRVREIALEAYAHQDLPFEELVRELKPERGLGQNPLFDVHFQVLKDIGSSDSPAPLRGDVYEIEGATAKFDLAIDFWEYPDGLWANIEYSTDLFSEQTIARMECHFRTLLAAMVANPQLPISELPILSETERRQVIREWNNTAVTYESNKCLHHLFEAQVELTPGAIAVIFQGEQLTYAELNRRSNRLAHRLIAGGVGPDAIVGICAERCIEMITGLLGILKAGGAYLPLDPSYPVERLHFMLREARPRLLLSQARLAKTIAANGLECLSLDDDRALDSHSDENPTTTVSSSNLGYVIYTSGSTGKPKGVMVHAQAVCNHLLWMQAAFPLTAGDRTVLKYPFNFDASVYEIFGPLIAGATLVVSDPALHWDISEFLQLLAEEKITALDVVPSMLDALLDENVFSACPALKRITSGGEPLSTELRDRFFARSGAELHNIYGPTEATIGATFWTCLPEALEEIVPIGRPIANTQIYILDSHLNTLPLGISGELCIGGDGIARGYLDHPELTAEKFIPDPFSDRTGGRLYRTGDRARRLSDGNIEYLGRLDQQIKLRGYRIELGEIESSLAQHPSVRGCAVVPIEEGDHARLAAYIVSAVEPAELWPSVGEHGVYDEFLYYAMTHDETRNRAYRAAIEGAVEDKIVLDIGTGADAVLARMCAEAGAARVYAIESGRDAFNRAQQLIDSLGLSDKITVIHGDSTQTELPETVDVCVSELIGMIGSSEGVVPILNDARRFFKEGGVTIPRRCVTRIAAVSLPATLKDRPSFSELPATYVSRIFEKVGHAFDLRLCVKNFPLSHIVSSDAVLEDFEFEGPLDPEFERDIKLTVTKDCSLQGFLLWLNLFPGDGEPIDSLNMRTGWLPVFWPAFYPGLEVSEGDTIEATYHARLGFDDRMPDYEIKGVLIRKLHDLLTFTYNSPHHTDGLGQNPFYRAIFQHYDAHFQSSPLSGRNGHNQIPTERPHSLVPDLRRFLRERLPEYMIPATFAVLDELPMTASGKLDREALRGRAHADRISDKFCVAPCNQTEQMITDIWRDLLAISRFGVHDNFFDLGGDSLLITRVRSRLQEFADKQISIIDLFRYPTVSSLARFIGTTETPAESFQAAEDRARKQLAAVGGRNRPMRWEAAANE